MQSSSAVNARLLLIATAVLFSTGGLAVKAAALSAWQVSSFRSGIAVLVLLAFLPDARRNWSWRAVLVGVPYAATFTCYVLANKYTTAINTIFLQATAPLYVMVLAPVLLNESVRKRDLWFLVALATGMLLIFARIEAPVATARAPLIGNLFGAGAGMSFALVLLGLRWLASREDTPGNAAVPAVVAGNVMACLVALPFALPLEGSPADWLIVGYLGVFQVGLAYVLLTRAIRQVPATEVSLLLLVEPVLNPLWVWLMLGEVPGVFALAGCSVILAATAFRTMSFGRRMS